MAIKTKFSDFIKEDVSDRKELRSVTVKYSGGAEITTSMASHLTDKEIEKYFEIGKEFNVGNVDDDMQKVVDVKINK